jgi:uncharacterized membrane protein
LAWLVCTAVLSMEVIGLNLPPILRLPTGAAFLLGTLYLMYSALTVVLYDDFRLDLRIALTVGAFFGITILIGIILNATPWGLTRLSWLTSFHLIASVGLLISAFGRNIKKQATPVVWGLSLTSVSLLILAIGLGVSAFALAHVGLQAQPRYGFTQFWMLPRAEDAPTVLTIGMYSAEHTPHTYTVRLLSNGVILQDWVAIPLNPDQTWEMTYTIPNTGITYPLTAELYRDAETAPYRRVEYWLSEVDRLSESTPQP